MTEERLKQLREIAENAPPFPPYTHEQLIAFDPKSQERLTTANLSQESEIAELRKDRSRLRLALEAVRDLKVAEFDHPPEKWAEHTPETCDECKRWRKMDHPLQHSCDGWYRLLYSREQINSDNQAGQHWEMRKIARDALATQEVTKAGV